MRAFPPLGHMVVWNVLHIVGTLRMCACPPKNKALHRATDFHKFLEPHRKGLKETVEDARNMGKSDEFPDLGIGQSDLVT